MKGIHRCSSHSHLRRITMFHLWQHIFGIFCYKNKNTQYRKIKFGIHECNKQEVGSWGLCWFGNKPVPFMPNVFLILKFRRGVDAHQCFLQPCSYGAISPCLISCVIRRLRQWTCLRLIAFHWWGESEFLENSHISPYSWPLFPVSFISENCFLVDKPWRLKEDNSHKNDCGSPIC